ncbi:hypothetical protein ACFV5K_01795, partial [Streptomyces sp. NPDC059744]
DLRSGGADPPTPSAMTVFAAGAGWTAAPVPTCAVHGVVLRCRPSRRAGGVRMQWGTLVATLGGAVIAISGTVLADRLRTRQEVDRGLGARRREAYIDFIAAAGAAHTQLRRLRPLTPPPTWSRPAARP